MQSEEKDQFPDNPKFQEVYKKINQMQRNKRVKNKDIDELMMKTGEAIEAAQESCNMEIMMHKNVSEEMMLKRRTTEKKCLLDLKILIKRTQICLPIENAIDQNLSHIEHFGCSINFHLVEWDKKGIITIWNELEDDYHNCAKGCKKKKKKMFYKIKSKLRQAEKLRQKCSTDGSQEYRKFKNCIEGEVPMDVCKSYQFKHTACFETLKINGNGKQF